MLFKLRPKESPWEVVERKAVDPVSMYPEDEEAGTYVFELPNDKSEADVRNAIVIARQQLLKEVAKKGFNILLSESWNLTIYRRGKHYRIEVRYCGRPAHTLGKLPSIHPPPFMEVLKDGLS
ncbi:hypothetical protein BT96DRAFT_930798 [Gymnopus androsaceus JB14]|uniref:Uncharacterized protein n=1 Tax=Gymnopus androsaceus JB14 TaxID=1447944 RepID=A0A6A4ILS6_9AGAR|nr:hypothetical protein BT96DRAFT_930798 [Gymnopus androsaceus JB14]